MVSIPICTVVIKNNTNIDLYKLTFVWLAKTNFPVNIKKIKKGDFKRVGMPNILEGLAPLKMYYTDESNYRNEYTILEELQGRSTRLICIDIIGLDESGGLNFEVDPKYDSHF